MRKAMRIHGSVVLGLVLVLTWGWLEAFGYGESGLLGGVSLLLVGACIVLPFVSLLTGNHRWFAAMLSIAGSLGATMLVVGLVAPRQREVAMRRGDRIGAALARYHQRDGVYPEDLAALVPTWLPRVPATGLGVLRERPFHYRRQADGDYLLAFDTATFTGLCRTAAGGWRWFD